MVSFSKTKFVFLILVSVSFVFADDVTSQTQQSKYREALQAANIKQNFEYFTSSAHIAGSDRDSETATYVKQKFEAYGLESWIEQFDVQLSYPINRSLSVIKNGKKMYEATLQEPAIVNDTTSNRTDIVPTFNGYSASGDVTAPVVFVNYGSVEDYQYLDSMNVSVNGTIVIARYGKLFRGCKVMLAEMRGALGVILYSDPNDDGIGRGDPYPDGPWRPYDGVQRGSVQYLSKCPGDPARNHPDCQNNLPKIPVLPISARDAEPIITNLTGNYSNWVTYWSNTTSFGNGGNVTVHLVVNMNSTNATIWNVFGRIGGIEDDRNVIIGAHRDAWVFGGVDPSTGSATLMEIAHGLGQVYNNNVTKPGKSILLASWDAEEYGLLGSTWYGERYNATIQDETIAYLNLDMAVYGTEFEVDATPSLNSIIRKIAQKVQQPNSNGTIADHWNGQINRIGSGSDYTVFIHYLGIPSASFGFSGKYGVYHSIYDSATWVETQADRNFTIHKAMAEYVGLLALNLTDAAIFPFNYTDYAHELSIYLNETSQLVSKLNASSKVDLHPLEVAIKNFTKYAHDIDKQIKNANLEDAVELMALNDRLIDAEKLMLDKDGLPSRPWYKHQIQAPGYYLGYGAEIFPGLTQSLNDGNWTQANIYVGKIARCITLSAGELAAVEDYSSVGGESYLGYQIFMILFTVFIIASFLGAIWYFRRSRKQFHRNHKYAVMEMDEQM